jgi:uncharacterized protein YecT (DUF1311 family)
LTERVIARLFAAAVVAITLASPALAGPMMPAGETPEAGLAGVWRVIDAKPAPWVSLRRLTKRDAPLLAYAIEFAANEVKGPAPLACSGATYSSGVTYRDEAFGGKLANDKDGALAKKLDLDDSQFTTFRVYCGARVRDFYVDDSYNLVMRAGDVIYTLERPTGMNPDQYVAGYSGPSFDCTRAKTTSEKLICRDAALSAFDRKLGEAYVALEKSISPQSFATFRNAQRAWLDYASKSCDADVPSPASIADRNNITDCLRAEFSDRADLLSDLKAAKAGAMTLEPRMRFRTRAKPPTEDSDIYPWFNGGGPAGAFNAFINKTLALDKWRMDDKQLFSLDAVGDMHLTARRSYTLARFDNRIVSLQISTRDYTGGNRDILGQQALTFDLVNGRAVTLDDVFLKDKDWKAFVLGRCRDDLHRQMSERNAPDLDEAGFAPAVAASSHWLWGSDHATIVFLIGTIGGLPGGEFDVGIPLKDLESYFKSDAPVR